ncbi:hypothetical protein C0991_005253 [Blastosporella zonata]|nr:hypothetical protein C0991_005253 [Blastosporella zonata]
MSTSASVLFYGMDSSFIEFWKDVKGLAFGEIPDYDAMSHRFEACWEYKKYGGRPGDVDWVTVVEKVDIGENTRSVV